VPEGDLRLIDRGGREISIDLRSVPLQSEPASVRGLVYTLRDRTEARARRRSSAANGALVESRTMRSSSRISMA